ncbi:Heterokaryon incompatibility, partial [Metarhizium brunneum ARSEF 3297]
MEPSVAVGYAALGYTWGKVIPERPKFQKQRAANNGNTGIPLPKKLPGTIAAAIKLASDIGIEYLWVDSICIDQEDGFEKQVQLANMAEIYGRATVCLVVVAGDNMDFGLPGFSNSRTRDAQSPLYLRGYTLGRGLEHPSNSIEKTYWSTRGWTFQ